LPETQNPDQRQGFGGVLRDVGESLSNVPGAIGDFLANLPSQAAASGKQVVTDPLRAILNLGGGVRKGLEGAINIFSNIAEYLSSRNIGKGGLEDFIKRLRIPESDLEQRLLGKPEEGDILLQGIGSFAPYAKIGGAAKGLAGLTKRAAAAGAYGVGQNQDPLVASLMGLTGEGVVRGLQKGAKVGNFLPSSPLSDAELLESANLTKGTETGLGDVIENPFLKRQLENVLPDIYGSGANQAAQRTASTIKEGGENLLNEMKGGHEGNDFGQVLQQALKSSESEARKTKTAKFNALNDAAEKAGVTTDRSNLRNEAKSALEKIEADPDLSLLADSGAKKLLKDLSEEKGEGAYSLKQTDFLRGKLGDKAHDAFMANNTDLGKIFRSLREAADKDINQSIDKSGNKELDNLRDEAFKYYKENYTPFEEPEIMKFTRKGGDADLLTNAFIKTSKVSDRANLLSKIANKLTPEERNVLSYSYFSRAIKDGELNPLALKTLYKSLGERQKQALLSDDMVKKLSDYSKLVQKNTDPLNVMFNPKTGQRQASWLGQSLPAIATGAGALATGSVPFTLLAGAIPSLIARPATKLLTNPGVRERIINSMIKARAKAATPHRNIAPFVNALMQSSQPEKKPLMELELNKFAGYQGQGEK